VHLRDAYVEEREQGATPGAGVPSE
jgi:hypothetical protein